MPFTRKSILIIVIASVSLLAGAFYFLKASAPKTNLNETNHESPIPPTHLETKLSQELKKPIPIDPRREQKSLSLSPECREFSSRLLQIDFYGKSKRNEPFLAIELPSIPKDNCFEWTEKEKSIHDRFLKSCQNTASDSNAVLQNDCQESILTYRTLLRRKILGQLKPQDITDLAELSGEIFYEFQNLDSKNPNFSTIEALADQLLKIAPQLAVGEKLKLGIGFINQHVSPKENGYEELARRAREALIKFPGLENDPNYRDIHVAVETDGFKPERLEKLIPELLKKNPNNDRAYFYQAYLSFKNQDRTNALFAITEAIRLDPKNEDYRKALQILKNPKSKSSDFMGYFRFGIDSSEF